MAKHNRRTSTRKHRNPRIFYRARVQWKEIDCSHLVDPAWTSPEQWKQHYDEERMLWGHPLSYPPGVGLELRPVNVVIDFYHPPVNTPEPDQQQESSHGEEAESKQ